MCAHKADYRIPWGESRWGVFHEIVKKSELLTQRRTENLTYDISELLQCCESFPKRIERLASGLKKAHKDSILLWNASRELVGEFEHIRKHIRRAAPAMETLQELARNKPPMDGKSDDEISEEALTEAWAMLDKVKKAWATSARRGSKAKTTVTRSKRKTRKTKKRVRKSARRG